MKNFSPEEIDATVYDSFEMWCAKKKIDNAETLGKLIIDKTLSEEVRGRVRRKFTEMLVAKYLPLIDGDAESLKFLQTKLMSIYLNSANKKIDISSDIPLYSDLASRHIKLNVTLLQHDRLYTLYQAVCNTRYIGGDIVEMGVFRGGSIKFISDIVEAQRCGRKIYGFDTFIGHVSVSKLDGRHSVGMFKSDDFNEVNNYVDSNLVKLISGDVTVTFPDYCKTSKGISLAHIDMDLYEPTKETLPQVWELLSDDGIILVDDYGFTTCPGVKVAVDEFISAIDNRGFHLTTGQYIIRK